MTSDKPIVMRRVLPWLYWALPLLLSAVQAVFTAQSLGKIQYEELAESVRNVYWFDQRTIYDGVSSNVGWYGLLWLTYTLFGFSLHTAKWVRLVFALLGLYAAAVLFKRYLPRQQPCLWLLILGLSPTALYFTTLQTTFGLDLALLPVVLLLLVKAAEQPQAGRTTLLWLAGAVSMFAALCFPIFLFYLPPLLLVAGQALWMPIETGRSKRCAVDLAALALGFFLPLIFVLLWLKQPGLLLDDPLTGSGLFRGGGGRMTWRWPNSAIAVGQTAYDLFFQGNSYYFRIPQSEFSLAAMLVPVAALAAFVRWGRASQPGRIVGWSLLLLSVLCVVGLTLGGGPPGIRRATPLIVACYGIAILAYRAVHDAAAPKWPRYLAWTGAGVLLAHHLAVAVPNLRFVGRQPIHDRGRWFVSQANAQASLDDWVKRVGQGEVLRCVDDPQQACRYSEIFGALASVQRFNQQAPASVLAVDPETGATLTLSISLWEDRRLPH